MVTCCEKSDLLALVLMSYCEVVTFPSVSWVSCGAWLYPFLIFVLFLTFKPRCSWSNSSKEQSNLGTRHYRTVTLKGELRYLSIGKFSCALYIYGPLHCPYSIISKTAESWHANMTLANSTDPIESVESHWSQPCLYTLELFLSTTIKILWMFSDNTLKVIKFACKCDTWGLQVWPESCPKINTGHSDLSLMVKLFCLIFLGPKILSLNERK